MEKASKSRPHVRLVMADYDKSEEDIDIRIVSGGDSGATDQGEPVCPSYANHGHCPDNDQCQLSHDIDKIVTVKNAEQDKKWRKRKMETPSDNSNANKVQRLEMTPSDSDKGEDGVKRVKAGGHRAGYDAFMTGFSFTTFLVHHTQLPAALPSCDSWAAANLNTEKIVNRIYLVSKDFPLLLQKSSFAKCSVQHDIKMKRLGLVEDENSTK